MGTFVSAPVPRLNNIFININSNQEKIHIHVLTRYSHLYTILNSDCSNKINLVGHGILVKWCYLHVQAFRPLKWIASVTYIYLWSNTRIKCQQIAASGKNHAFEIFSLNKNFEQWIHEHSEFLGQTYIPCFVFLVTSKRYKSN